MSEAAAPASSSYPGRASGNRGQKIMVKANAFKLVVPTATFYYYDEFSNRRTSKWKRIKAIDTLQMFMEPEMFDEKAVFDGVSNLFCPAEIRRVPSSVRFDVNLNHTDPTAKRDVVGLTLTRVAAVTSSDLEAVILGAPHTEQSLTRIQVLNVLLRHVPVASDFTARGSSFYVEQDRFSIKHHLEVWRGFFQSIRPSPYDMVANADITAALMYHRGPIISFVMSALDKSNVRDLERLRPQDMAKLKSLLITHPQKVIVTTPSLKDREYAIQNIIPLTGTVEFQKDGETMTVEGYFLRFKGYRLRFPRIPGIRTGKGAILPFELCDIKKGQFYRKKPSPDERDSVIQFSKKTPFERMSLIRRGIDVLSHTRNPFMGQANMKIDKDPVDVPARLLEPPALLPGGNRTLVPRGASWDWAGHRFWQTTNIKIWACVRFLRLHGEAEERLVYTRIRNYLTRVKNRLECLGLSFSSDNIPTPLACNGSRPIPQQLLQAGVGGQPPDFIIVILPKFPDDIRVEVKRFGDVAYGCPTQCVLSDMVMECDVRPGRGLNDRYFTNLALKINVKLGNTNVVLAPNTQDPGLKWLGSAATMVIGADIMHPGPGFARPSVAAIVASVDEHAAKYVAFSAVQRPRVEMMEDLKGMVINALCNFHDYRTYYKHRQGCLPKRILYFRDGVSEGEYAALQEEFQAIKDACVEYGNRLDPPVSLNPQVTLVVVGKRHHNRFFPSEYADRTKNCPPGLVVDKGVVSPNMFDFYLQSHAGKQGTTSRPSHNVVLRDENNFDPDTLQALCYALCHINQRASCSVSIPAPVYYADLVCSRAEIHFKPGAGFTSGSTLDLEAWKRDFAPAHPGIARSMYFT